MIIEGVCIRSFTSDLAVEGDGRTIVGLLAPYNEPAWVNDGFGDYLEEFAPGCFERCIGHGNATYLRVQLEHDGHWVGRGQTWIDSKEGLRAELRLDATQAGQEAAYKIADGQTPGLSLGFRPYPSDRRGKLSDGRTGIRRTRVKTLHHVALCPTPAYESAKVEAIREAPEVKTAERLAYWQEWTQRVRR